MNALRVMLATGLVLGCLSGAGAEIKLINGTGQELLIDVLSQRGEVKDVKLAADPSPAVHIGARAPALESQMLVVKTPDGAEKYRTEVQAGRIYLLHLWNPYLVDYVGEYLGGEARDSFPRIINATGVPLVVDMTFNDYTTSPGWTLEGPDGNTKVTFKSLGSSRSVGELVDATFKTTDGGPPMNVKLKCGVVYYLSRDASGNLKLQEVGTI